MNNYFLFLCIVFLFGCIGAPEAEEKCKGNECVIEAFKKCEMYSGTWQGEYGSIDVRILGKNDTKCSVSVIIPGNGLNISGKSMRCNVPMNDNATFSIKGECEGELMPFFDS